MLQSTLVGEGEGPIITPPPAPRIRAGMATLLLSHYFEKIVNLYSS